MFLAGAALLGAWLACPARAWSTPYITPELDHWLTEGIDDIYQMRFDEAETAARKAIALAPDEPHAYMGLAGVDWTRYVYGTDQGDPRLLDSFARRTQQTISVGQRWVKAHPGDAQGLMTLGAAYGLASRLAIIRHQWIRGYLEGRKAVSITRLAVQADPRCWDCYLGVGMYDYYTDVYPRFIGALAKFVLRGDRLRGIRTLEMVARRGHYSRANAMILLVEIYTEDRWGARDPEKALAIMRRLRALYPGSAMMHAAEVVTLYEGGRYEDAAADARAFLSLVREGKYDAIEAGKGGVALGCALWRLGRHEEALAAFRQAETVDFGGRPSRWAVWARVRAGQLEDALGRRADALADYRAAAATPDTWGFGYVAKAGVAAPYAKTEPGPIAPPDD